MEENRQTNAPKSLALYLMLAYFFSWIIFILLALNRHGVISLVPLDKEHERVLDIWHAFGGLGPGIAAVITIGIYYGANGLRHLFRRYSLKHISATGWFYSLSPFLLLAVGLVVARIANGEWFDFAAFIERTSMNTPFNVFAWLLPSFFYGFGEEAGWRGYLLPKLQEKHSPLIASTILTVCWVGWHVPSFFYRYELNVGMLIGLVIGIYAGSIWLTYLFNSTRGSLLAVSVWHLTWDVVSMIEKDGVIAATMSTLIMISAILVVIIYKKNLSREKKVLLLE